MKLYMFETSAARSLFLKEVNDIFTRYNVNIRINVNGKNLEIYFEEKDSQVESVIDAKYAEAVRS